MVHPPDGHERCLACLGFNHAQAALVDESCSHCGNMPIVMLRSRLNDLHGGRVPSVTPQFISSSRRETLADGHGDLRVTVWNNLKILPWATPPCTSEAVELPGEPGSSRRPSVSFGAPVDDAMSLTASQGGLDSSGDEDSAALPPSEMPALPELDPELMAMLARAAESIGLEWSSPPSPSAQGWVIGSWGRLVLASALSAFHPGSASGGHQVPVDFPWPSGVLRLLFPRRSGGQPCIPWPSFKSIRRRCSGTYTREELTRGSSKRCALPPTSLYGQQRSVRGPWVRWRRRLPNICGSTWPICGRLRELFFSTPPYPRLGSSAVWSRTPLRNAHPSLASSVRTRNLTSPPHRDATPPMPGPVVLPRCPSVGMSVVHMTPLVSFLGAWLQLPNLSCWLARTIRLGYAIQFAPPYWRGCDRDRPSSRNEVRLLQPLLHCTQEERWVMANPGPAHLEQNPSQASIQDVDS
ncbi:hypothetical protein PO909_009143 [Leuciscus waleckii]